MLPRKKHDVEGITLPDEWTKEFTDLLNSTYKDEINKQGKSFFVLGFTYPDEVVMAISFMDERDMNALPVTLVVSADLNEGQKAKELLDTLIDSVGVFFDSHFVKYFFISFSTSPAVISPTTAITALLGT